MDLKDNGFTLMELMAVVVLISVLTLVTLPPVMRAVERREVSNAAQAAIDLVDFAKVQASARNRAYELVPVASTGGTGLNGSITLNESPTSACINFGAGLQGVRTLDLAKEYPQIHVVSTRPSALLVNHLCIKPDGRVLDAVTQLPIASGDSLYAAGDALITFQRKEANGNPEGVKHVLLLPFNGAARVAFE